MRTCRRRAFLLAAAGLALCGPAIPVAAGEAVVVWEVARRAGATLPDPVLADASAGCRATTGVARSGGVLVSLRCPGALGTRSTHPALYGLRLANGWKVRETRVVVVAQSKAGFDLEKPAPGSDRPSLKGSLWAGPGGEVLLEIYVRVEGPDGTSWARDP